VFRIEYDPSILVIANHDRSAVSYIGTVIQTEARSNFHDKWSVFPERYHKYINVFLPETDRELPPHTSYDHANNMTHGSQPPRGPFYALSATKLPALREYLDKMLKMGKIRPSKTPESAPILFVPKPHGRGLRLCVDYHGHNRVTVMNHYPLPLMNELRDRVQGSKMF